MATKLGKIVADFTSQLATKISVGGTTATLQSATDDDGNALASGRYFFTIDGDNTRKEHISADLSGTALTNIKSISRAGVESTGVAREHRVGATISITDFAHIKYLNDLLDGTTNLNASTPLEYDGTATINADNQLATKAYTDGVAIAGAPDSTVTVKGLVEKATTAEIDAGTATGGSGPLGVSPDQLASSIYNTRLPSADQKAALVGTSGTPSTSNKYVTNDDTTGTGDVIRQSALLNIFGDGSDGDVVISTNTSLTKDMYYDDLTINNGVTLSPAGFRIFVKGVLTNNGTIANNGNNGTNGTTSNSTPAGGAATGAGSLPPGIAGGAGAAGGGSNPGSNGTAGGSAAKSIGAAGAAGGDGGLGDGGNETDGGAGGAKTGTVFNTLKTVLSAYYLIDNQPSIASLTGTAGSGGGGGGGGVTGTGSTPTGGSGGGGGGGGGTIAIFANTLDNVGSITANGGNGGNGMNGPATNGGGGGGGGAGSGGVIILVYRSNPTVGTLSVAAGTPGTGGTGHGTGTSGTNGASGNAGVVYSITYF